MRALKHGMWPNPQAASRKPQGIMALKRMIIADPPLLSYDRKL
jgi:hypothetical protein